MCDSVDLLLTLQNPDGGFASYELIRGPSWLEWLNPAEVFGQFFFWFDVNCLSDLNKNKNVCSGDIMIEYCYPECTTSVITSLSIFRKHFPDYRTHDIG